MTAGNSQITDNSGLRSGVRPINPSVCGTPLETLCEQSAAKSSRCSCIGAIDIAGVMPKDGVMTIGLVLGFLGIAVLAYITPGPDWFVVMRYAVNDRRAGLISALGVQTGLSVHMTAAALGVAALLLASAEAFTVLKLAGAAYLIFLGVQSIVRAHRLVKRPEPDQEVSHQYASLFAVYRQSFYANVLNPKAALFFAAVLPQFLSPSLPAAPQVLFLGALDIALGIGWWFIFVYGITKVRRLLGRARSRITIDRFSGVALIGLGSGLALADSPRA